MISIENVEPAAQNKEKAPLGGVPKCRGPVEQYGFKMTQNDPWRPKTVSRPPKRVSAVACTHVILKRFRITSLTSPFIPFPLLFLCFALLARRFQWKSWTFTNLSLRPEIVQNLLPPLSLCMKLCSKQAKNTPKTHDSVGEEIKKWVFVSQTLGFTVAFVTPEYHRIRRNLVFS